MLLSNEFHWILKDIFEAKKIIENMPWRYQPPIKLTKKVKPEEQLLTNTHMFSYNVRHMRIKFAP